MGAVLPSLLQPIFERALTDKKRAVDSGSFQLSCVMVYEVSNEEAVTFQSWVGLCCLGRVTTRYFISGIS